MQGIKGSKSMRIFKKTTLLALDGDIVRSKNRLLQEYFDRSR